MSDKEILVKAAASHATAIAKIIFPRIPEQALQTLITIGVNNKLSDPKITQFTDLLFDTEGNLPSPDEFWEVFKGVLNDKPITFEVFKNKITINGADIDEIRSIYNTKKAYQ